MHVWNDLGGWFKRRREISGNVGFVPTMGALHRGHLSLVERCRKENDIAVVSIFVNPSQFNEKKDLERYPRTLETDLAMLRDGGVDDVLVPSASEMYPNGYSLRLEPDPAVAGLMEAAHRPGFLQGVMTVVLKLFNIVHADRAYFGEKDYQQLITIEAMVREFFLPVKIVPCPTVREPSGLAMSSRNMLLSEASRQHAAGLYRALTTGATVDDARGILEAEAFQVDYVEEHWGRRFVAAFLDGIRLIDNVPTSSVENR